MHTAQVRIPSGPRRRSGPALVPALLAAAQAMACSDKRPRVARLAIGPVDDAAAPLQARTLPARDASADIGTSSPIAFLTAAPDGAWVVACQARADTDGEDGIAVRLGQHGDLYGDEMSPYLFRGGGPGQPLDGLVAHSRDGHALVLVRDDQLILVDDAAGTEVTLPDADTRPDQAGLARCASFDATGKRLVYFRTGQGGARVIVRDLTTDRERTLPLPRVEPWHVVPATEGPWAQLRFIAEDSNKNGSLDWPRIHTNAPLGQACTGPATSYSRFGGAEGDEVRTAWLNVETGEVREDPAMLTFLGGRAVRKTADKSIKVGDEVFVPASCDGEVLAASVAPPRLVVACSSGDGLELYGPGVHARLPGGGDRPDPGRGVQPLDSPYLCVGPTECVALADGQPVALRGHVVGIVGANILTKEGEQYFLKVGASAAPRPLAGAEGYPTAGGGDFLAFDSTIVELSQAVVKGVVAGQPLAFDAAGRVLTAHGGGSLEFPRGPLRWVWPVPDTLPALDVSDPTLHWRIEGVAVDAQGRAVADAVVTVSELQGDAQPWTQPGVSLGFETMAYFSQYPLPARTDAQGRFAWSPSSGDGLLPGGHAVMVIAGDGRVGAVDTIRPGRGPETVVLQQPATLRVECKGFSPMGYVEIVSGHRRLGAACGGTVTGLPNGAYLVAAKKGAFEYAGQRVELRSGETSVAVLEVMPAGEVSGRVVAYPGDQPVAGISCTARWSLGQGQIGGDPSVTSGPDGSFRLRVSQGGIQAHCDGDGYAPGRTFVEVTAAATAATVRVVRLRANGVPLGAEVVAEPGGARVLAVQKRAARLGFRPGDLVLAVDDTPLEGLSTEAMKALAFFWPLDGRPRWHVEREGKRLTIQTP